TRLRTWRLTGRFRAARKWLPRLIFPPRVRRAEPSAQEFNGGRKFMNVVLIAIGCGLLAVLYGLITIMQVLKAPAGSERMQDIASAVQEGARAYLARQYMTIAIVGVVVVVLVGYFLGLIPAIGFLIGAIL